MIKRIIYLESIAVPFDAAKELNNTVPSALAWVYNKWNGLDEWEVKPVQELQLNEKWEKLLPGEKPNPDKETKKLLIGNNVEYWELHPTGNFDSNEQIESLIEEGKFYYAPLLAEVQLKLLTKQDPALLPQRMARKGIPKMAGRNFKRRKF